MLASTYILRLGQLLKIALNLKKYMWQKLKQKKPNITSKMILEPNVAIMVETHSEVDIATIKVNNQMAVIQV
jgi:Fe-S cluster assembly ATPase SufC